MAVLVIGANGLLGSATVKLLLRRETDVIGAYHSESPQFDIPLVQLDVKKTDPMATLIDKYEVETVINCAALTDVDACETNPELANKVNSIAPGRLATICSSREIDFVHFSTDYVFDGQSESFYTENDPPRPVQTYGHSKLAGERSVRDAKPDSLILRLSFLYGSRGDSGELEGFPQWVAQNLVAGESVQLFTDQYLTPSRVGQVAKTTLSLLDSDTSGLFHVASRSCVTPYEFGIEVSDLIDGDETLITPSSISNIDRNAKRPQCSCLDVSKVERRLERQQPTLSEDLSTLEPNFGP